MKNWKYKYLLNYEGIYFKRDDVEECIERIIEEFRTLSQGMRAERRFSYDESRIYLVESIIDYKVFETEIIFSIDDKNKVVRIVNSIEDEYELELYIEFRRGQISNKFIINSLNVQRAFDLYRAIDEAIEFLVTEH